MSQRRHDRERAGAAEEAVDDKYLEHMPIESPCTRFARAGIDVTPQTLGRGVCAGIDLLEPVAKAIEEQTRAQEKSGGLHYLFAPLKHARLDYMVQKAVEMGVSRLAPVVTRRTQTARVNLERMRANAIEAAEQCGIICLPEIAEPVTLEKALASWPQDRKLIFCDEHEAVSDPVAALRLAIPDRGAPLALLIGPEGGFEDSERRLILDMPQAAPLSLGPRILRADTAAVAALAIVQAAIGDWRE